jgi:hypothetical protein
MKRVPGLPSVALAAAYTLARLTEVREASPAVASPVPVGHLAA